MISSIEELLKKVKKYNPDAVENVKRAYEIANYYHTGQTRQSGEPYIVHPLNVAYTLAELYADEDTLVAGLLHDTLEDTKYTKEGIENDFNKEVAMLVDGVTKISKLNFDSKEEQHNYNTRKIITSVMTDVRIIIIKLADRLHNMRTLDSKPNKLKQKENAIETLDIFVPFAYYLGSYKIKNELEDISLKYINPDKYKEIEELRMKIENDPKTNDCIEDMTKKISGLLDFQGYNYKLDFMIKNIYGIYKRLEEGHKISDIHDLIILKVLLEHISQCYLSMGLIHSQFRQLNGKMKDYIYTPKTNMYRSIHTTVRGKHGKLVQAQIRTFSMDVVDTYGLPAYWETTKGEARVLMQRELTEKFQFIESLRQIDDMFKDNEEFVKHVKEELFNKMVYVFTPKGDVIELPAGSTPIDFAYAVHTDIGNNMIGVEVNDEEVPINYTFQNNDRVNIITGELSNEERTKLIKYAHTTRAKRKIKSLIKE